VVLQIGDRRLAPRQDDEIAAREPARRRPQVAATSGSARSGATSSVLATRGCSTTATFERARHRRRVDRQRQGTIFLVETVGEPRNDGQHGTAGQGLERGDPLLEQRRIRPRNRFTTTPSTRARSSAGEQLERPLHLREHAPAIDVGLPARWPRRPGPRGRRFTKSTAIKLSSTGEPAPSSTIVRWRAAGDPAPPPRRRQLIFPVKSRAPRRGRGLSQDHHLGLASVVGFNSTGFMSTCGASRRPGLQICARDISPPSAVTPACSRHVLGLERRRIAPRVARSRQEGRRDQALADIRRRPEHSYRAHCSRRWCGTTMLESRPPWNA
jgi:hypothetical protein